MGPPVTINTAERHGLWTAWAERENGDRFGVECSAASEPEARDKLERWLAWQEAHAAALSTLQEAERAYHRTIAGSAFASPTEGPSALELQKDALARVESARRALDGIRSRKPE